MKVSVMLHLNLYISVVNTHRYLSYYKRYNEYICLRGHMHEILVTCLHFCCHIDDRTVLILQVLMLQSLFKVYDSRA